MAGNGAAPEEKEKLDPEGGYGENELDDSKAKFINGGKNLEDSAVVEVSSGDLSVAFTGLGKEELKKYADDPFWVRLRWILFILFWVGWLAMLVAAIIIIVFAPRCPSRPDLKWYHKDAAYNVYAKSFLDGAKNSDGQGDLAGVIQKQPYVKELGANTIWLSAIFKTDPAGKGIVDYKALDEKFGTVDDFRGFLKSMMKKDVRVIVDLIPDATSKEHEWFNKSRKNESGFGDYYVWTAQPNNWKDENGKSMWAVDSERGMSYLLRGDSRPALNLRNEKVLKEFKAIMEYWVGVGVSGFHIQNAEHLTVNASLIDDDAKMTQTRNFPDNIDVIDYLRRVVDGMDNKPGREKLLSATVTSTDPDTIKMYYGGPDGKKGVHMVSAVLDKLDSSATAVKIADMLDPYINISSKHWLGWRLSSPYVSRIATRMDRDKVTVAHALQALLPGTAQPYYGDEIGMKDGTGMGFDKYRTPMQWTKEEFAGFSEVAPWTPVNNDYSKINVATLTAQLSPDKMMKSFKELFALRQKESMQFGRTMVCTDDNLLFISRRAEGFPSFLVTINLGDSPNAHIFKGDECVGGKETAEIVFHSQPEHASTSLDLSQAVHVGAGEVIVLQFAK